MVVFLCAMLQPKNNRAFFLFVRIFVLSLQRLNQSNTTKMKVELTEKENDLIQAIRNYRKSYIYSNREMVYYIERLLAELMDGEE